MSDFKAIWQIKGIVHQTRELKSSKNADWRGYIISVQTMGGTYEVNAQPDDYKVLKVGDACLFTGEFEEVNTRLRLNLRKFEVVKAA